MIIIGGIYGGIFSPTEAASVSVLYALILEVAIFRSLKVSDIPAIALSTGLITAVVFILVGGRRGVLLDHLVRADPAGDPRLARP